MSPENDNGWSEYKKLVMDKLDNYRADLLNIFDKLEIMNKDNADKHARVLSEISALKVKSGLWGALSGAVTAVGTMLMAWIMSKAKGS